MEKVSDLQVNIVREMPLAEDAKKTARLCYKAINANLAILRGKYKNEVYQKTKDMVKSHWFRYFASPPNCFTDGENQTWWVIFNEELNEQEILNE